MNLQIVDTLTMFGYKLACLFVAVSAIYMGYKLFFATAIAPQSDIQLGLKEWLKVNFKKAAPGSVFALFGMVIATVTIFRGYEVHDFTSNPGEQTAVLPLDLTVIGAAPNGAAFTELDAYKAGVAAYNQNDWQNALTALSKFSFANSQLLNSNKSRAISDFSLQLSAAIRNCRQHALESNSDHWRIGHTQHNLQDQAPPSGDAEG